MTWDGREGFVEVRFSDVVTFFPPIHMGYSRPNSEATFFSASSIFWRFSGLVKSGKWSLVSAVAMAHFLLDLQTAYCTAFGNGATSTASRCLVGAKLGPALRQAGAARLGGRPLQESK